MTPNLVQLEVTSTSTMTSTLDLTVDDDDLDDGVLNVSNATEMENESTLVAANGRGWKQMGESLVVSKSNFIVLWLIYLQLYLLECINQPTTS